MGIITLSKEEKLKQIIKSNNCNLPMYTPSVNHIDRNHFFFKSYALDTL